MEGKGPAGVTDISDLLGSSPGIIVPFASRDGDDARVLVVPNDWVFVLQEYHS